MDHLGDNMCEWAQLNTGADMAWIVIFTKPRQEESAKKNLENLGLVVTYPVKPIEKINRESISISFEPLFPRYIFVRSNSASFGKMSHKLRNVRGVAQIIKFGGKYAQLDDTIVEEILNYEKALLLNPVKAFNPGDSVSFTYGAFRDIQAAYQESDGDKRVIVLFDLLSKPVRLSVPLKAVKRI